MKGMVGPVVDWSVLRKLFGKEPPMGRKLVSGFLADAESSLHDLRAALSIGAVEKVRRIAHRLVSPSGSLGMASLTPLLAEVEKKGRQGELAGVEELAESAVRELGRAKEVLQGYLDGGPLPAADDAL